MSGEYTGRGFLCLEFRVFKWFIGTTLAHVDATFLEGAKYLFLVTFKLVGVVFMALLVSTTLVGVVCVVSIVAESKLVGVTSMMSTMFVGSIMAECRELLVGGASMVLVGGASTVLVGAVSILFMTAESDPRVVDTIPTVQVGVVSVPWRSVDETEGSEEEGGLMSEGLPSAAGERGVVSVLPQ
jgi:hypothetical protein